MKCDRCQNETTVTKTFDYKDRSRGTFEKFVCQSGCKDPWQGKSYKHTFFPPRESLPQMPNAQPAEVMKRLKNLEVMLGKLLEAQGIVNVTPEELEPDADVPF